MSIDDQGLPRQSRSRSRRQFVKGVIARGSLLVASGVVSESLTACSTAPPPAHTPTVDGRLFLDTSGREVSIGGKPISWWVTRYGLPLSFTYGPAITANVEAFKNVFSRHYWNGEIRFAAKAEAHPIVLRLIGQAGAGVAATSCFEVQSALEAGISPDKIDVNGNAKSDDLIDLAIGKDMLIIADSLDELHAIAARAGGRRPRVLLRVSGYELGKLSDSSLFAAGTWSKFGTPISEIPAVIGNLRKLPVQVVGLHTHIGSQITSVDLYRAVLGRLIELGHQLRQAGHQLEVINIGGGFPLSYLEKPQWESMLRRIRDGRISAQRGDGSKAFVWGDTAGKFAVDSRGFPVEWDGESLYTPLPKEYLLEKLLTGTVLVDGKVHSTVEALKAAGTPRLIIEPGRAIAADAGIAIAQVRFLKTLANGSNLVALDSNRMFTSGGTIKTHRWGFTEDPHRKDTAPFEAFLAGNLSSMDDMLTPLKVSLPRKPKTGDILMAAATGAYSTTFSAANADSFPRPTRIFIGGDGAVKELHNRDSYQQVFSL